MDNSNRKMAFWLSITVLGSMAVVSYLDRSGLADKLLLSVFLTTIGVIVLAIVSRLTRAKPPVLRLVYLAVSTLAIIGILYPLYI